MICLPRGSASLLPSIHHLRRWLHRDSNIYIRRVTRSFQRISFGTSKKEDTTVIGSWIDHPAVPAPLRPYFRLARVDKQVGTALLFWPCLWSIALAAPAGALPHMPTILKFGTGAVIMRSAGCIINDIWDR